MLLFCSVCNHKLGSGILVTYFSKFSILYAPIIITIFRNFVNCCNIEVPLYFAWCWCRLVECITDMISFFCLWQIHFYMGLAFSSISCLPKTPPQYPPILFLPFAWHYSCHLFPSWSWSSFWVFSFHFHVQNLLDTVFILTVWPYNLILFFIFQTNYLYILFQIDYFLNILLFLLLS